MPDGSVRSGRDGGKTRRRALSYIGSGLSTARQDLTLDAPWTDPIVVMNRYEYMVEVVESLIALGGFATPQDVYLWLEHHGRAPENDLSIVQQDGGTRFRKEVRWARKELFDAGVIENESGGWLLLRPWTPGSFTVDQAREMIRERTKARRIAPGVKSEGQNAGLSTDSRRVSAPTTGPTPTAWVREVAHSLNGPAYTYLLQFGEHPIWKVGFTRSLRIRLRDINAHIPTELLGDAWEVRRSKKWPSPLLAFRMEQKVLAAFGEHRSSGERVKAPGPLVFRTWEAVLQDDPVMEPDVIEVRSEANL